FIKKHKEEQAANARYWKIPACCDDDDDYNFAIIPNEPVDSLSMGDEHLNTILAIESDEFIKSSVENLVPNPSKSEGENSCDVPACFTTFSNVLFDADYEFDSSDNQSLYDEDVPKKFFLNPLFEEEIISMKIDQHHYNDESDLIESLLNHDSSIIPSSSKIDSLLDEFAEFVSENSDADIESFFPSPIPIKDSDSFMEDIDLSFTPDDPMPPGVEEDDYDSERDILIREEFLDNYSLSLLKNESFRFDIPSFSHPTTKPPHGNTGILNIKMMDDIFEQKVPMPRLTITRVSNQEISPDLLSHWSLETFQPFTKCPMLIHGKNIPILDVPLFHFYPLDQLNDSFMEDIDLSFTSDDPMTPSVEEDDYDSERDILIREELLDNYSLSLLENESFRFDIPSFSRPTAKPPHGNTGILNIKMMDDISEQKVPMPRLTITRVSNQEISPDLLSHWSLETFWPFTKCPMLIHGKNIPILDVPLFHFYPLNQLKYDGNWVKLSDRKQALCGRHPMLIRSLVFSNEQCVLAMCYCCVETHFSFVSCLVCFVVI
nr:hypothetical protein [Tanacetum cinerariifolium]